MLASKKGFTLIELLVVITILSILAMVGMSSFRKSLDRGSDGKTISEIKEIQKALETYYSVNNSYPASTAELITELDTADYFPSGVPKKEFNDSDYTYVYNGGDYLLCGSLKAGGGNYGGDSATGFLDDNSGDMFCVVNLQ
ncbi:type II secretion system protein [Candidatus Beckwithbacteria bacterium]|nr:type II secretion system protein [Candidatus Beckwithbacteria bacterium]